MPLNMSSSRHWQLILFLVIVSYVFLMAGNSVMSLTHPDEVFYVQTAKEMIARHSWMTPYIFDEPQFEKPILFYWLLIAAIKIFGLTPFAARFFPAFFGMAAVVVIYWISWMLFRNKRISFLSGIILSSSFIHFALSRAVLIDMVFSVWVAVTLGFFYWGYHNPQRKNAGIILAFVFSAIAVLTKGLLGFCFPAGVILIYLFLRRDISFLKSRAVLWGAFLFMLIVVPWHALMIKLYGQAFTHEYFQNVHIRRLLEAEHRKSNTWYFYPATVILGVMPWTFFMFPAIALFIRKLREEGSARSVFQFLLAWLIGIFIFVQPAQSKLASYILPIFPAVVILLAYYLQAGVSHRGFKIAGYGLTLFLLLTPVAAVIAVGKYRSFVPDIKPIFVGIILIAACGLALLRFLLRDQRERFIAAIPCVTLSLFIIAISGKPYAEPWVSCRQISDVFKSTDASESVVLASKFYVRGVRYYTDRPVAVIDIAGHPFFSPHPIPFLSTDTDVDHFLRRQPATFCVVKESDLEALKRIVMNGGFSMTPLRDIGGKHLLKIENRMLSKKAIDN